MRGALAVTAISTTLGPLALASSRQAQAAIPSFGFMEIPAGVDANHRVAPGCKAEILIRWGDPVLPGAPEFDPMAQTAEKQRGQFGYNNDLLGYFPIEGSSEHGLLVVHHEYTNEELMFPGMGGPHDEKEVNFARADSTSARSDCAAAAVSRRPRRRRWRHDGRPASASAGCAAAGPRSRRSPGAAPAPCRCRRR
jgi:secreted PhoX family phosphatase